MILFEHGPSDLDRAPLAALPARQEGSHDGQGVSRFHRKPCQFTAPKTLIIADEPEALGPALAKAEALRRQGYWLAGYLSYEAGYALEPRLRALMPKDRPAPLLLLGAYEGPEDASETLAAMHEAGQSTQISPALPAISREDYQIAMTRLLEYIAAGDCYQVNLTFPLKASLTAGSAFGLYGALRRSGPVGHGAYLDLGIGPTLVSRSPELFFRLDESGLIEARPMKGTRPRDADPERDAAIAAELASAVKDRAENLMIVDLLRNDISRITCPGSVKVPSLFAIEHYSTVHQMVSSVEGQLLEAASLPHLMEALFPCGSVTGAPKIRAMEIIRELEPHPRGVYCGAIGWMAPDGRADFSVAIRTLSINDREITLNVGGGIVQDSTADGEWEEALWKARFVKAATSQGSV